MAAVKNYIQDIKSLLDKNLQDKNCFTNILEKIESKTGIKKLHIVIGLIVLFSLYLMFGYGGDFLCNFIGFVYPAYCSIKAIETREKDDDTKWLTYWVVYSIFSLIEYFTDIFLFWVPFYSFIKCAFLVYCMLPSKYNGSVNLYYKFIRPFILKHELTIDKGLDTVSQKAKDVAKEVSKHID